MSRDWESTFRNWAKPLCDPNAANYDYAERIVKDAILSDPGLSAMDIKIFAQGSYRNNTNVRYNDNIDICICLMAAFYFSLPENNQNPEDYHIIPPTYHFEDYKNTVENALVQKFGRTDVSRGNKALALHAVSPHCIVNVLPCFEHRRYLRLPDKDGTPHYLSGTEFWTDNGIQIINWPNQHYENGVDKNKNTDNKYKSITRALKKLKNEMAEKEIAEAKQIPSYLLECLAWNTPSDGYKYDDFLGCVRYVLANAFNDTITYKSCRDWVEVNKQNYLFTSSQSWNYKQVNTFIDKAWDYIGF